MHESCTIMYGPVRLHSPLVPFSYVPLMPLCGPNRSYCHRVQSPSLGSLPCPNRPSVASASTRPSSLNIPAGLACALPQQAPPTSPYATGSNASSRAAVAFSAPPAGSAPAVPSAMEGAAPPQPAAFSSPRSCVSTPNLSAFLPSILAFTIVPASPRAFTQLVTAKPLRLNVET